MRETYKSTIRSQPARKGEALMAAARFAFVDGLGLAVLVGAAVAIAHRSTQPAHEAAQPACGMPQAA
jgi:hypothetical protein